MEKVKETKAKLPLVVNNADGTVTVRLKEPARFGDDVAVELVLSKPKAKHLKGLNLKEMKADELILLAAKLSGQFPQLIEDLGMDDFLCVAGVVGDFLGGGATVGKTP